MEAGAELEGDIAGGFDGAVKGFAGLSNGLNAQLEGAIGGNAGGANLKKFVNVGGEGAIGGNIKSKGEAAADLGAQ